MTAQLSWFEPPPVVEPVGHGVIVPRDYQREQDAAIDRELLTHRATGIVAATGSGKTIVLGMQALKHAPFLVLAQEESPIEQAAQKLRHILGKPVAIEKAEQRAWVGAEYVVASVQSLRAARLADFKRRFPYFKRIAIDEAHHSVAPTYMAIAGAYPEARVFGLSATWDRGDKKAMGMLYDTIAHEYGLYDAIRDGWLVRPDWQPMNVAGVKLDDVGIKGGDLDQDQLDAQTSRVAAEIAHAVVQHCKGLQTIIYAPGVETARVAAAALNEIEAGSARAIWGELLNKGDVRKAHKRGDFPYIVTCQMLIEAHDDERLRCVVDLAKTKSRLRFAQKVGRVTRPWPGTVDQWATAEERRAAIAASPKPKALFFDANYGQHGHTLALATDLILGGRWDDRIRKLAQGLLDKSGGGDIVEALEEAEKEVRRRDERAVRRAALRAAKATGDVLVGKPLGDAEMFGESVDLDTETRPFDLPGWLVKQGFRDAHGWTREQQIAKRRTIIERKRRGLGSHRQVWRLMDLGVPERMAKATPAKRCGLVIGRLQVSPGNWRRFNVERDGWMLGPGIDS